MSDKAVKLVCHKCNGTGVVSESKLRPFTRGIINALRGHHLNGVAESDLIERVYRGHKKPFYPLVSLQGVIRALNRRLIGMRIVARDNTYSRGKERRYRLLGTTDGDHHADRTDHRTVHRHKPRHTPHGGAAAREAE